MKAEYEVRVLDINKKEIEQSLKNIGAKFVGEFEQKRYCYYLPEPDKSKWIRLRTNGITTTLAYKQKSNILGGTKEVEFEVSDFDTAHEFLSIIGIKILNYQENKRTQYKLGNVEFDIDSWPEIPTYLEIEATGETEINEMIKKLGLEKKIITSEHVDVVYEKYYGINIHDYKELKF